MLKWFQDILLSGVQWMRSSWLVFLVKLNFDMNCLSKSQEMGSIVMSMLGVMLSWY